jgi:hypothetical protein
LDGMIALTNGHDGIWGGHRKSSGMKAVPSRAFDLFACILARLKRIVKVHKS